MRLSPPLLAAATLLSGPLAAQTVRAGDDPRLAAVEQRIAATRPLLIGDPARALPQAHQVLAMAQALPPSPRAQVAVATAQWLDGEAHLGLNQVDRAAPLIEAGLATAARVARNTKLQGDLLRSRGAIAANTGHFKDALQAFQNAYSVFTAAHEPRAQAMTLQDIGMIFESAGDYERALGYYAQMRETFGKDPVLLVTGYNNEAMVLHKLGREAEAEAQYKAALRLARGLGGAVLEVRVLSNLAAVQATRGEIGAAQASVDRALLLSRSGEAAGWRPFVLGMTAKVAAARGDFRQAASEFGVMFAGVNLTTTDMSYLEFHQAAADVYAKLGQNDLALEHLRAFHRLNDSARDLTASAGAQLMAARFDFAHQDLKISELKQGQLRRDIELERQRSHLRTVLLAGALGTGGVIVALLLFGYFSIRRSRNEVRDANVTLTQVNDKLEKALKAKTDFLATTSHEIRTPLNGILGMTQVLLARPGLDRETREKVEVVHGAGETMRALVDDILDVAKMETGEVTVAHEPTRLRQVLIETARLWRGHAETKGVQLVLDAADDVPAAIMSDETRLRQVVSNLLSNAVKFTEHGLITLTARRASDQAGDWLSLAVADTGIGIPAEQHAAIFEPFHQVDGATTRQFSGTGLGLAIVQRLAEALGGGMTLASEPGKGSTFALRMPLTPVAVPAPVAATATERPHALADASVLVVEANPLTQSILRSLLAPHVRSVAAVADGDLAVAALSAGGVHHLLIEPASARIDGRVGAGALRELVEHASDAGALSTLLFAPTDGLPAGDVLAAGASQTVIKPVGGADLLAAMRGLYDPAAATAPAAVAAAA